MITTTTARDAPMPRPGLRPSDSARCARLARFRPAALTRLAVLHWPRLALGAVLALAAFLNIWQLDRLGYANTYYAAAVKSMLQSWHNFFFVSFDPGGFVSIDKPPLGFWIETASAKLFGFSGVSLILPEALAGVLTVAVLYRLVARIWGRGAGLLAALFLALTPISAVTARNNTIDSLLVLTVLLAAWAVARAVETGKLRWLLLCAVLVGLGFNIKMLESYLVVPAFGLVYLVGARASWRKRLGQLALATVVLLGVSLSWVAAVDLTPASARPYVGSSGSNSELSLALGYNGLQRLTGALFAHATRTATTASGAADGAGGGMFTGGPAGPFRLLGTTLGGQVSWLLVLAVLGLLVAATRVSWRRLDKRAHSLVLWGTWLLTAGTFFSVAEFFHEYYTVMLAPAIAALAAIGVATLWREYRARGWRGWLLPAVLLASAAAQAYILRDYPAWSRWLTPLVVGTCLVAAGALVVARLRPRRLVRVALVAAGVAVTSLLVAPTTWAAYSVLNGTNGSLPTAGPSAQTRDGFGDSRMGGAGAFGGMNGTRGGAPAFGAGFAGGAPGGAGGRDMRDRVDTGLIRYLETHQGHATYLVATASSMNASSIIIATGKPVMALGGFGGSDQILTVQQLARLVANGTVQYFLLQSGGPGGAPSGSTLRELPAALRAQIEKGGAFGGFGGRSSNSVLVQWVIRHGTVVPASKYETSSTSTTGGVGQATLYYVSSAAAST
jgi:4-amino-4-deoxy-L-arabinose transferase-like glycosyltransferase